MNILIFTARAGDPAFETWKKIDKVILSHRPTHLRGLGYEGLFDWAPKYFGFSTMRRPNNQHIQYEFTEAKWIIFKLKWL